MGQDLVSYITGICLCSKIAVQKVLSRKVYCEDAKSTSVANYFILLIKRSPLNIPILETTYNICMTICCEK
jgi:hypothetical protein